MIIRIDYSGIDADRLRVDASLVYDETPGAPVFATRTFHFDADTSAVAALVQIQKDLSVSATQAGKFDALSTALPVGATFPAKSEAETRTFLGMEKA